MIVTVFAAQGEYLVHTVLEAGGHDLPSHAVLLRHEDGPIRKLFPDPLAVPEHIRLNSSVDPLEFLKILLRDPLHGRIVRDRVVPVEEEAVVLGVVKLPESRALRPSFRFPVFRREAYEPVTAGIPLRQIAGKLLQRTRGIPTDAAGIKLDIVILRQMVIVEPALHRAIGLIKKDLVLRL